MTLNRRSFGAWGIDLDEVDFARALASAGVLGESLSNIEPQDAQSYEKALKAIDPGMGGPPLEVKFDSSFDFMERGTGSRPPDPRALSKAWSTTFEGRYLPRLEIAESLDPGFEISREDLFWLSEQLSYTGSPVHVRADEPDVPVIWDWPLRVGLLSDERSEAIGAFLRGTSVGGEQFWWPQLVSVVELDPSGPPSDSVTGSPPGECDVLVLPFSLRTSVSEVLKLRRRIKADVVLVTGSLRTGAARAAALLSTLRLEVETAGVGVCFVPRMKRLGWLRDLVEHLSHDEPLDRALSFAASAANQKPILFASRRLIESAQLRSHLERLAQRIESAGEAVSEAEAEPHEDEPPPAPVPDLRTAMEGAAANPAETARVIRAHKFDFSGESHGATEITDAKRNLPHELRRPRAAGARSSGAERSPRRVLAQAFARPDKGEGWEPAKTGLRAGLPHKLEIWIGTKTDWGAAASARIREELLPASTTGHLLTLVFYPLRARSYREEAQTCEIHLPETGESERAIFFFQAPGAAAFKARVVVLHQNRVLQTLLFNGNVIEAGSVESGEYTIEEEAIVQPHLEHFETERGFDAALVFNESPAGEIGLCAVAGAKATIHSPQGLEDLIPIIEQRLTELTELAEPPDSLDHQELINLLFFLALHGHSLWDKVVAGSGMEDQLTAARRLHVVATKPGEFVPIEFFYPRDAPRDPATICTHVRQALDGAGESTCPSDPPESEICPLEFWGFNRVIERYPFVALPNATGREAELAHLEVFKRALVGASEKVFPENIDGPNGILELLTRLCEEPPLRAKNWDEWRDAIQEHAPTLLVLLPHSGMDAMKQPTIEISGHLLREANLTRKHVRAESAQTGPVVLLLGCTTNLAKIAFQNFAEAFKRKNASVVLSTLSVIRGRHAADLATDLLQELEKASGNDALTFGDVLLAVKRKRLGKGDPLALSLVAYGDADWRF